MTIEELKQDLLEELNDRKDEILGSEYPEDIIHEIVDSHVPVYTQSILKVVMSDLDLAFIVPEVRGGNGSDCAVNILIGVIYEELREVADEWLQSQQKEE